MAGSEEAEAGDRKASAGDPLERHRLIGLGAAVMVLFPVLAWSGIWDPYELDAADLARRIAVRVLGAHALALPNAVNTLPTLTDLRMGELPFTSMALGFRLFGLHDWSGRLMLAVWGLAGAAALFELLARLVDRRAGVYGAVALVTMPLYFVQARTMLGDVVTMAALSIAFSGLVGALLDGDAMRPRWLAAGVAGLVAGYLSRGAILGVAVPALTAGVTWLVLRGSTQEPRGSRGPDVVGALSLAVGLAALAVGARYLFTTAPDAPIPRALGFALLKKPPTEATFDLVVRQLGHALFPWSAFLPFAFGRLLRAPVEAPPAARDREVGVRVALLVGAALAYGAYAFLAPRTGALAFSGPALLAGVAAIAVLDLERGAPPSRALSLGTLLFGGVILSDILRQPEKALAAFVVDKPQFPRSFEADGGKRVILIFALFVGILALTWFEDQPRGWWRGPRAWVDDRVEEYRALGREIGDVWAGNLVFGLVVVEAALVGLGAMIFIGRRVGFQPVDRLPKNVADWGVNVWWIAPVVILAALPLWWIVRDLIFRALVDASRLPRATFTLIAALLAGAAQGFWYYPALAAQVSPKEAFDAYAHLAGKGEPLALLSVRSRAAAYYAGSEVESFTDVNRAFAWLTERADQRRWLMLKADDLPRLNHLYRARGGKNLPILDGRSSQILLASNILGDHRNESWLSRVVLDEPPHPATPLDVIFEDQIAAIGWEVTDKDGRSVGSVVAGTPYHLRVYYKVLRPISGNWKAFVHIDGSQRRHNGDHNVLDGKYAMSLWRPGDVVVDDLPFTLGPEFNGPGDYTVYFGFFSGDTRLKVSRGQQHENRAVAGTLHVR